MLQLTITINTRGYTGVDRIVTQRLLAGSSTVRFGEMGGGVGATIRVSGVRTFTGDTCWAIISLDGTKVAARTDTNVITIVDGARTHKSST